MAPGSPGSILGAFPSCGPFAGPRAVPELIPFFCPFLSLERGIRGRLLRRKFTESECFFQKLSLVLRLLGFVASPPSPFPPSLSPPPLFLFHSLFFFEGQNPDNLVKAIVKKMTGCTNYVNKDDGDENA
ncbi:hypothetical protein HJG60_011386 [Phyllostomus discolor]|uniref:Uncharacterized protein n=1 Tax=Phyllostomus discolor TaxID=89673 RepID=A0A834E5D2_9CHIR|nr:hypothetical protein HJG60_011386 [Phyllostomus discolor]